MIDAHHEILTLRATNADLRQRIAELDALLRQRESADALLRESEAREAHIKQVLLAIRSVNQLIVQATDTRQLIEQACMCLTETLGYYSAWIALLDALEQPVRMVAASGFASDVAGVSRRLERGEFPRPIQQAFAQADTVVVAAPQDSWPDELPAESAVGCSVLARRLAFGGRVYGVMAVSVPARFAYDDEEIALFTEVVSDLSFALRKIEDVAALGENTRMLGALMDNLPGMVYQCANDPDWTMFFVSAGARTLSGYDHNDLAVHRQVSYASQIHADDRDQVWSVIQAALAAREPFEIEYRICLADGQEKWVMERGHGVFAPDDRLLHLEGFITDITERKQADEKIRQTENFYRALIEHAPDGVVLVRDGEFAYLSPSAMRLFGYDPSKPPSGTPISLTHPDDLPHVLAALQGVIADPTLVPVIQYRFQHHDGSWRWIESTISNLTGVAGVEALVINFHDITERRRAEATLAAERALLAERVESRTAELRSANAELSRAARLKDEFLANMSHELRTPLNDILGRAELLEAEIYGPISPKQGEALRSIDASGRHLLALITDILDLSKIEAGKLTLQLEMIDVRLACQMSLHMVAQSALQKQIALDLALDAQVAMIYVDERRLKQILVNLLSNAVKFTPAGGKIGLEVAGDAQRQTVTFTVWDSGIGIAEEQRPQLFQPFTQIDSGLNRQYAGTGLGLSLVQRLAQAHGGSVTLDSAPGQGSRFSVTLPWYPLQTPAPQMSPEPAPAPPDQAQPAGPGREPQRILLVDDTESNNIVVAEYLHAHGYTVLTAWNGIEALELMAAESPALVLMDIQMPGMDGLTAIRRIRGDPATASVPIIALTALAMPGDRERCLEAGANAYLIKPVSLRTLRAMIATLLPLH